MGSGTRGGSKSGRTGHHSQYPTGILHDSSAQNSGPLRVRGPLLGDTAMLLSNYKSWLLPRQEKKSLSW